MADGETCFGKWPHSGSRSGLLCAAVSFAAVLFSQMARAQTAGSEPDQQFIDNRGLLAPTLQPDLNSPLNTVRSIRLINSQDDLFLLCAGDDRVVHWWKVNLDSGGKPSDLVLVRTLRWPIARGKGQIRALDAAVGDNEVRVAFGGDGVYPSRVMLYSDRRTPTVLDPAELGRAHQTVRAIRFHPSHPELLAVGYGGNPEARDAGIILWKTTASGTQPLLKTDSGLGFIDGLEFNPSGDRLAVYDSADGELREFSVDADSPSIKPAGPVIKTASGDFRTEILGLVWAAGTGWKAATRTHGLIEPGRVRFDEFQITNRTSGRVTLHDSAKADTLATLQPGESATLPAKSVFVRAGKRESKALPLAGIRGFCHVLDVRNTEQGVPFLGFAGRSSAGSSSSDGRFSLTAREGLEIPGLPIQRPEAVLESQDQATKRTVFSVPGIEDAIRASAVSSDGKIVAFATRVRPAGSDFAPVSVCLFDGETGRQSILQTSLSTQINFVRIAPVKQDGLDTEAIQFGSFGQTGNLQRQASAGFPATSRMTLTLNDIQLRRPIERTQESISPRQLWQIVPGNDGWSLQRLKSDGDAALNDKFVIPYLPELGPPASAVAFQGANSRMIAVGYGSGRIAVWEKKSDRAVSVRLFHGHDGAVLSLDVSDDSQWLVSGGEDGVIRGWLLSGLSSAASISERNDKELNELGIELEADALVLRRVKSGWPGFFAGFKEGDAVVGVLEIQSDGQEVAVPPSERRRALLLPTPGRQLLVTVESNGQPGTLYTTAMHEPLFEFWPLSDGQWLISTPQKFFAGSSRETMRRFGWNVNLGRQGVSNVRFFPLETFAGDFDNGYEIVSAIRKRKPLLVTQDVAYPSSISIESVVRRDNHENVLGSLAAPTDLEVTVSVKRTGNETVESAALWCNGRRFDLPDLGAALPQTVTIPSDSLRRGVANLLVASVSSVSDGRVLTGREVQTIVVNEGADPDRRIHFIGVGITALDDASAFEQQQILPLKFTANDAWHFGAALHERATRAASGLKPGFFGYALTKEDVAGRFDQSIASSIVEPTREGILSLFKELRGQIRSADDFVCVLIAGHGFNYRECGTDGEEGFFFVARDTQVDLCTAVSGRELFDGFSEMPCPVLVLIDACQSGGISSNAGIRQAGQLSLGPEIIASSQSRQLSYESEKIRNSNGQWIGHGLFTAAGIEFLSGQQIVVKGADRQMSAMTAASRDVDRDSHLTMSELAVYLQTRVPKLQVELGLSGDDRLPQNPEILPSTSFAAETVYFSANND